MFNRFKFKFESGITLVELLIVMGLIGILASGIIIIIDPTSQMKKANDAKRKSDLAQVQRALETYYQDYGRYPARTVSYAISGSTGWGGTWTSYMSTVPRDTTTGRTYIYYTPTNGQCANNQCYFIYASLQRNNDSQACNAGAACTSITSGVYAAPPSTVACGGTCNYGVSSPNVRP